MAEKEKGAGGFYDLEEPAEPATVAHTVRVRTTLGAVAARFGLALEELLAHNGELRGWTRHPATRELSHAVPVEAGTIVHLPAGTVVNEPAKEPEPVVNEPVEEHAQA